MTTDDSQVPEGLHYSTEHEWLRIEGDEATVGITYYAQDELGDVVYVEQPKLGATVAFMGKLGEIESVKVASEIFSPAAGEVIETNAALLDAPELVNKDPYGEGWLVKLRLTEATLPAELMDAEGYRELLRREAGEA